MRAPSWLRNLFKAKIPVLAPKLLITSSTRKELLPKERTKPTKRNKAQRNARKNNWRNH